MNRKIVAQAAFHSLLVVAAGFLMAALLRWAFQEPEEPPVATQAFEIEALR